MDRLVTRAVLGSPQDMFAIEEVKLTDFRNLYGLVQCTPDLSQHFCNVSLRNALDAIPTCCGGRDGGRVLAPSCTIRYESGPFFETNGTTVTLFLLRIHLRSHRPTQPSLLVINFSSLLLSFQTCIFIYIYIEIACVIGWSHIHDCLTMLRTYKERKLTPLSFLGSLILGDNGVGSGWVAPSQPHLVYSK